MSGTIYKAYDAGDNVLYVGASVNLATRLQTHRSRSPWWEEAVRIDLEHHDVGRNDLLRIEGERIRELDPVHNVGKLERQRHRARGLRKMGRPPGHLLGVVEFESMFINLGLTGLEFATRAGIGASTLSTIRNGYGKASNETARKIAAALGCSPVDIFPTFGTDLAASAA